MLRKFHASALLNDDMSKDDVNSMQGKSKTKTDESYFFDDPDKLKQKYIQHLSAVTIALIFSRAIHMCRPDSAIRA